MHAEHSSKSEGLESSLNLYNLNMHHPKRRPVELHTERGMFFFYGSQLSHYHGSEKWVPPIVVAFQLRPFSTSMIMAERVVPW